MTTHAFPDAFPGALLGTDAPERRRIFTTTRALPETVARLKKPCGLFIATRVLLEPGEHFDLEVRVEGTTAAVTLPARVIGRRPGAGLIVGLEGSDVRAIEIGALGGRTPMLKIA